MTKAAQLITAAAALELYDFAVSKAGDAKDLRTAADAMAHVLRARAAPGPKREARATTPAERFLAALAPVAAVVDQRWTVPVLGNVRLGRKGDHLVLTATDLDMEVQTSVELPGDKMLTTVPAKALTSALRGAKGDVGLEMVEGTRCRAEIAGTVTNFQTITAGDYPDLALPATTATVTFDVAVLVKALKTVRPAVSTEETRYYMNGVFMGRANGPAGSVTKFVACDGHRLLTHDVPTPIEGDLRDDQGAGMGVILPRKLVDWIIAHGRGDRVALMISNGGVILRFDNGPLAKSKVIDGSFPDYRRVMPADGFKTVLEVNASDWAPAIKRLVSISKEKSRSVRLEIKSDGVGASFKTMDGESAGVALPVRSMTGEPLVIGVNAIYLMEQLIVAGSVVTMSLQDAASPIRFDYPTEPDTHGVCMPLRV